MRPNLLQRLFDSMAPASLRLGGGAQVEVTPPAIWRRERPFSQRLQDWFGGGVLDSTVTWPRSAASAGGRMLGAARQEFAEALDDIRPPHAAETLNRIRTARSLHELWHLRSEVFSLVSKHHDQAEAGRRVAALNRHFPSRSRRSHFTRFKTRDARESLPPL